MLIRKYLTILLIIISILFINAMAQDKPPEENESKTDETITQEQESETSTAPQDNSPETPDSFKPSEEISEDLSVSFPVDI